MLARHEEIRRPKQGAEKSVIVGFSRRKNNKCRNPSHACTPRKNLSPPLWPVTSACAHVRQTSTQSGRTLDVFLGVSFRYVFIICLAPTLALPEILLLPAKDACRNFITICRPTQENKGISILTTTRLV